jgi:hypothetical protein
VLQKQKKNVKRHPSQKRKKKTISNFFHLDKFQPKEESKRISSENKEKMDEKSGKPSSVVERLILKGESEIRTHGTGKFI